MSIKNNKITTLSKVKRRFRGIIATGLMGVLVSTSAFADFVHTDGTKILDENGQPLFLSGINLGNWLLWEGYLMMGDFNYRTHTQFLNSLTTVFGSHNRAKEFEHQWRLNYVDDKAIEDLKSLGFNSVRVPFHYNMFWENGQLSDHGFQYFDQVIDSARTHGLYVLLDMHAAPGYQNPGDHADNVDSNASQPRDTVKFWDGTENIQIASDVWRHIASRYKDEPVVWGYDLFNEPVPQEGREFELLGSLIEIRNAIREVDNNHIIVAEGSWWSSDLTKIDWSDPLVQQATGVSEQWDDNLVYQIHHYGPASGTFGREDITNNLNIPLIIGEYGESDTSNLAAITEWAKQELAGYFPWSFKKMSHDKTLWTIPPNSRYNELKGYINNGGSGPSDLYDAMISFAQNNIRNGAANLEWHQDFYDAVNPSNEAPPPVVAPTCDENDSISVLPGKIQAENYCAMEGIQEESTSDIDGELNIGWIDAGDFAEYRVDVSSAGQYTLVSRVASPAGSNGFDVMLNDSIIGSVLIPATGGWQTWQSIATSVELPAGVSNLKLAFKGGDFNVNWLDVVEDYVTYEPCDDVTAFALPGRLPVESYCEQSGVLFEDTSDVGGGQNLGWTDAGDSIEFRISANQYDEFDLNVRVASNVSSAEMEVFIDEESIAIFDIPSTGGWQQWQTLTKQVAVDSGEYRMKIVFNQGGVNVNWIEFDTTDGTTDPVDPPVTSIDAGTYSIVNVSTGKALDVSGISFSDGANVHQWAYGGGANQRWAVSNYDSEFELVSVNSGKCLDADSGSSNVQQWSCFGNENQRWLVEPRTSGHYVIRSVQNSSVLQVENANFNNGANIIIGDFTDSDHQKWIFTSVE